MKDIFLYLYMGFAACMIVLWETRHCRRRSSERDAHMDELSRDE
ncbi:MAG TPA: hypothetical protein VFJ29_03545 [Candidatus Kapabacteria bacterium]|nr:hypothetical protein [Candidatus Kapabacteria bacterium]